MRHWIKDCFCIGLSNSIAVPAYIGTRLLYGRQAKRRTKLSQVVAGFLMGLIVLGAIAIGMVFGV